MGTYATLADIKRYLRSEYPTDSGLNKINIGQAGDYTTDVNEDEVNLFITDIETKLTETLTSKGISITTAAGRYMVIRWVCYEIYRVLYPRASVNEIPAAVQGWKKEADEFLELKSGGKLTGEICDWSDTL